MTAAISKKKLSAEQREVLLSALKARFDDNMIRHQGVQWARVEAKLAANPAKLRLSQWCAVLLWRQGVPWLAEDLNFGFWIASLKSLCRWSSVVPRLEPEQQ